MINYLASVFAVIVGWIFIFPYALLNSAIVAFFLMLCWNYAIPDLFGLAHITYLKAFCLSWVVQLLTKPTKIDLTMPKNKRII
jgi:hypothetical protein